MVSQKPKFVPHVYGKISFSQCTQEGWVNQYFIPKNDINITEMLKVVHQEAGKTKKPKEFRAYAKNTENEEFLQDLANDLGTVIYAQSLDTCPERLFYRSGHVYPLVVKITGQIEAKNEVQGTFVHPDVAKHVLMWASPRFAITAIRTIDAVINGDFTP
ncbi:MAG: KilA-N domain-containing protein [Moorea sp. SIO4G2]|nr:KilA-N domain-containing protein [Moorena sp. SIO4G2]